MRLMTLLFGVALTSALVACGGGGGSAGSSGTGTGTGIGTTPAVVPKAMVTVRNASNASVTSISFGGAFTVQALVTDAAGLPVANRAVTFAVTDASIATLPTPPTALTDASGIARVAISPASISSIGATTVSASATVSSSAVTGQTDFAVSPSNVSLSSVTLGSNNLVSAGNTSVSVTAQLNGAAFTGVPVNVAFTATCGRINGSGGNVSVTTDGSGVANATYTAVALDGTPCSGAVNISATTSGATPSTAQLTVAAPVANAVTFVSATPAQIFLANSGAANKALLKFRVFSGSAPLANVAVSFSITLNPGAVVLGAASGTSDANGEVSVQVTAGTVPGPLRVKAALTTTPSVFAESQNLTVASGPPSQKFMSLSVSTFNIEGQVIDGTSTSLTVRIADRQGNPVDDGTVINFTAEGGQVAQSCATARVNGISQCAVNFVSQNPRPANGRVSVLAYTNGIKDFTAANTNNTFDPGELTPAQDQGDAYRDDNENGAYDIGEFVLPLGGMGSCTGKGEPFPSRAGTCDNTTVSTTVRQQPVILFSSSTAAIDLISKGLGGLSFNVRSAGYASPNLPMPAGTTVGASVIPVSGSACTIVGGVTGSPIPNVAPGTDPAANLVTGHSINLTGCTAGDQIRIDVTAPSGLVTTQGFSLP